MLYRLRRHPFGVRAFFRHSLVLTYALPQAVLKPMLPPGLVLDTYGEFGFLAIALVQTTALRPDFLPAWMGQRFFLSGYRIFTRLDRPGSTLPGSSLRGLRILRSDTDNRFMAMAGNVLTHYAYEHARVDASSSDTELHIRVVTKSGGADLEVTADIGNQPAVLPPESPFPDLHSARKFAGPLPYTFDYEAETKSIVMVRGVRENWNPQPVNVDVRRCAYLDREPFRGTGLRLANAFHLQNVNYRWERGVRVPVGAYGDQR